MMHVQQHRLPILDGGVIHLVQPHADESDNSVTSNRNNETEKEETTIDEAPTDNITILVNNTANEKIIKEETTIDETPTEDTTILARVGNVSTRLDT